MFRKIVAVSSLAALFITVWAWSHCHDTLVCEDIDGDLIGNKSWTPGTTVQYRVNNTRYQQFPKLALDCREAAYQWANIRVDGNKIRINFNRAGVTDKVAKGVSDDVNVISYGPHTWNARHKVHAEAYLFDDNNDNVFDEVDMLFNYYAPYEQHQYAGFYDVCIRHIAAHEFGHWLGLLDLHEDTCSEYEHYTMLRGQPTGETNSHWRESLSCEDKHAADLIYGTD